MAIRALSATIVSLDEKTARDDTLTVHVDFNTKCTLDELLQEIHLSIPDTGFVQSRELVSCALLPPNKELQEGAMRKITQYLQHSANWSGEKKWLEVVPLTKKGLCLRDIRDVEAGCQLNMCVAMQLKTVTYDKQLTWRAYNKLWLDNT